jgi:hypothetical protein
MREARQGRRERGGDGEKNEREIKKGGGKKKLGWLGEGNG